MSFLQKALLQVKSPIYEFRRFRGKINIQRPRKPRFLRQLMIDVCEPIYPRKDHLPMIEKCRNVDTRVKDEIENPFEYILAKECLNWFNHSRMVAFFHANPVSMEEKFPVFADLKMENMHLRTYGRKIVKMALHGTHFEEINKLFVSQTQIVFSEAVQVKSLLKILKKLPQLVLIAGIVDGKFVSRNEFMAYASLPSLDVSRAQLCQVLEKSGSNIVHQMMQHQLALVSNLDRYADILGKDGAEKESEEK